MLKSPTRLQGVCGIFVLSLIYSKNAQERCLILIDGSNFFFKLKSLQLHNLLSFDFTAFSNLFSRDDSLVGATYFVGKVLLTRFQ